MLEIFKKWIWKIISTTVGTIQTLLIVLRFVGAIDCNWLVVFTPMFSITLITLLISIIKIIRRKRE